MPRLRLRAGRRDRARRRRGSSPQVRGGALVAVAAFDQDIGPVGERERGADVLLDQHDGDAASRGSRRACANTSSTSFGDRPADGSSSISTAARPSARARPPASAAGRRTAARPSSRRWRARSGNVANIAAMRARRARASASMSPRAADCPRPTCAAKTFSVCGTKARPAANHAVRRQPRDVLAVEQHRARRDRHEPGDRLDRRSICRRRSGRAPRRSRPPRPAARRRGRSAGRARSRRRAPRPRAAACTAHAARRRDRPRSRAGSRGDLGRRALGRAAGPPPSRARARRAAPPCPCCARSEER